MNTRSIGAELAFLAAAALWFYGGSALVVAVAGDGEAISVLAPASVVVLSYGLMRSLRQLSITERALRLSGGALSLALFYVILRIEVAGEPYVWDLRWLPDLLSDPSGTLEGRAGDVAEIVLLGAVWVWGVRRGLAGMTHDGLLAELSPGLVTVLVAAAFAPVAHAPEALRWLPAPYLLAAFLALALAYRCSGEVDSSRSYPMYYAAWIGTVLVGIAGLALAASVFDPPSLDAVGRGVLLVGRGASIALAYAVSPFIIVAAWSTAWLVDWLGSGNEALQLSDPSKFAEQTESEQNGPGILDYAFRSGLVALVIAFALAVLWFSIRRVAGRRADGQEVREEVASLPGPPSADLRALFSVALSHLPGWSRRQPRDPIVRLYLAILRQTAARGLSRPLSATPLEFASRLRSHWGSPVVEAISRAYSEARYGRRHLRREEINDLRARWEEVLRSAGRRSGS
jgi:hypothetical protein